MTVFPFEFWRPSPSNSSKKAYKIKDHDFLECSFSLNVKTQRKELRPVFETAATKFGRKEKHECQMARLFVYLHSVLPCVPADVKRCRLECALTHRVVHCQSVSFLTSAAQKSFAILGTLWGRNSLSPHQRLCQQPGSVVLWVMVGGINRSSFAKPVDALTIDYNHALWGGFNLFLLNATVQCHCNHSFGPIQKICAVWRS